MISKRQFHVGTYKSAYLAIVGAANVFSSIWCYTHTDHLGVVELIVLGVWAAIGAIILLIGAIRIICLLIVVLLIFILKDNALQGDPEAIRAIADFDPEWIYKNVNNGPRE